MSGKITVDLNALASLPIGGKGDIDCLVIEKLSADKIAIHTPGTSFEIEKVVQSSQGTGNTLAMLHLRPAGLMSSVVNMKQGADGTIYYTKEGTIIPRTTSEFKYLQSREAEMLEVATKSFDDVENVLTGNFANFVKGEKVEMPEGFSYEVKKADEEKIVKDILEKQASGVVLKDGQKAILERNEKVKAGKAVIVRIIYKGVLNKLYEVSPLAYVQL